jgi:hypothetical protein
MILGFLAETSDGDRASKFAYRGAALNERAYLHSAGTETTGLVRG